MKMIVFSMLHYGLLGAPTKNKDTETWQFTLGKQYYIQRDFWEIGLSRYQCKNKFTLRYGVDAGYRYRSYEREIDLTQMVKYPAISVSAQYFYVTKYWKDHFFRLKPYVESGYKFIQKKKYSSDILFCTGIGLNVYRNFEHHYYLLDTNLYSSGDLIIESGTYDAYSFFRRPELFFGARNTHYFKIKKKNELFFDYLIGYNIGIYPDAKYRYNNGLCLQFRLGYSLLS